MNPFPQLASRPLATILAAFLATAAPLGHLAAQERQEEVTISLPAPPLSFDPTATVSATDRAVFGMISGTLFRPDIDGTIVPALAESIEYADDFASATVTLREGQMFSDGTPVTAADVAATFMGNKAVEGSVLGAMSNRIENVEAVDDRTVHFTFTGPFPSFGDFSSSTSFGIYPATGLENRPEFFQLPVTSGPYKLTSGWSGNSLTVVRNEHYAGPEPLVDEITLTVIEDANSAISQLQSGEVDYAGDLPPNYLLQLQGEPGITVETVPVYGFYDLRLWNPDGPFSDPRVRNAVAEAIDREAIVRSIWGDTNQPLAGFWPPSMDWHDPTIDAERDLDAARELLAGTECEDGCQVRMMYSDQEFPFSSQLALILQNQLAEIGIEVQLERLDAASLIQRLREGDYDMVPGAMASAANIPDHLLGNALLGTGPLKAEFTGYNSEQMNDLIARVNASTGEERAAAAAELEALFDEDQPYVTLAPWVRGTASRLPEGPVSLVGTCLVLGRVEP